MSVFDLHAAVLADYRDYVRSFFAVADDRARAFIEQGPGLVHVGTSATMVADRNAAPRERRATVAEFAQRLFGHPFNETQVIEETLVPFTEGGLPSPAELVAALSGAVPETIEEFRRHPWPGGRKAEFGMEAEEGGQLRRRVPRALSDGAARLATATGAEPAACETRLRETLTLAGVLPAEDGGRAFAFKLHQFIGQGVPSSRLWKRQTGASSRSRARRRRVAGGSSSR